MPAPDNRRAGQDWKDEAQRIKIHGNTLDADIVFAVSFYVLLSLQTCDKYCNIQGDLAHH